MKTFLCFLCFCGWLERDGLFGPELKFAVFMDFGPGWCATSDLNDMCEHALADLIDRFSSIDYATGRQIEIVRHAVEHRRV